MLVEFLPPPRSATTSSSSTARTSICNHEQTKRYGNAHGSYIKCVSPDCQKRWKWNAPQREWVPHDPPAQRQPTTSLGATAIMDGQWMLTPMEDEVLDPLP
eukprot:6455897-Amphidinium_carterae.1